MRPGIKAAEGATKTQEPMTAETRSPVNSALQDERSPAGAQQAAGNLAIQRLLRSGGIQTKLAVSQPGDELEREADRIADRVVSGESKAQPPCVCGGQSGADCPQCGSKTGTAQLKPNNDAALSPIPATGLNFGAGSPLDTTTRDFMESRFGLGFGDVQVHTGAESAESAASINARAYTIGTDIVFGANEYAPGTSEGKRLLAHELTHIVQQHRGGQPAIQRQTDNAPASTDSGGSTTAAAPAPGTASTLTANRPEGLIVDDKTQEPAPHQMRRSEFVGKTKSAVAAIAVQTLASSPFGEVMRPQVTQEMRNQFIFYSGLDNRSLENSIRAQVPGAVGATTAAGLIVPICEIVRQNIAAILPKPGEFATGLAGTAMNAVSTIREGIGTVTDTVGGALSSIGSSAASTIGSILFKAQEGGPKKTDNAGGIHAQLGGGTGLDHRVREGMSSAFGHDFGEVRVHTDARAARLAEQLNARAFTIGRDIAFAAGEYQPGTLIGDALIAHELAHVAQQRGATSESIMPNAPSNEDAFEEDADSAAVRAVMGLWSGAQGMLSGIQQSAMPALRSGLKLRRCGDKKPTPELTPTTPTATPAPKPLEPLRDELERTNKNRPWAINKVMDDLKVDRTLLDGGTMHYRSELGGYGKTFTPTGFARTPDDKKQELAYRVGKHEKSHVKIGEACFEAKGWTTLYTTVWHEYQHVLQAAAKKDIIAPIRNKGLIGAEQEVEAYSRDIIASGKLIENKVVDQNEAGVVKDTINESWDRLSEKWRNIKSPSKELTELRNQAKAVKESLK